MNVLIDSSANVIRPNMFNSKLLNRHYNPSVVMMDLSTVLQDLCTFLP